MPSLLGELGRRPAISLVNMMVCASVAARSRMIPVFRYLKELGG